MTKRLAGSSRPKPSFPIGHRSVKSTVCSPVSYMAQDLVQNHMKSHYRRISSAKACVDTSVPKSMKLTIKEKDRKRREALRSAPNSPRSSSRNSQGTSSKMQEEDFTLTNSINGYDYLNNEETKIKSTRNELTGKQTRSRRLESPLMDLRKDLYKDVLCGDTSLQNSMIDQNGYTQYERTKNRSPEILHSDRQRPEMLTEWQATDRDEIGTLDYTQRTRDIINNDEAQFDRHYTSTPRFGESSHTDDISDLDMSRVSFSYKRPPSAGRKAKKSTHEVIWTEEQKYLNFITDVTNDILARGIFSNRVLNRVFETHIEKRNDELEEEHMREMIHQLKEDLGITANS